MDKIEWYKDLKQSLELIKSGGLNIDDYIKEVSEKCVEKECTACSGSGFYCGKHCGACMGTGLEEYD